MVPQPPQRTEFHFQTITVQNLLSELIREVTTITEARPLQPGESAESFVIDVEAKLEKFLQNAEITLNECPVLTGSRKGLLQSALSDVERTGYQMVEVGRELIKDTSSSERRRRAVEAARNLLSTMVRFLELCDQLDVLMIVTNIDLAQEEYNGLKSATTEQEIYDRYRAILGQIEEIETSTRRRVGDLVDPSQRDDFLAARALLKTHTPILYGSTKALLHHPTNAGLRENCEYAHQEINHAFEMMRRVLNGQSGDYANLGHAGRLMKDLELFQQQVFMEPAAYKPTKHRPELEELLEVIVSQAGHIADSASTRNERKQKIINECNNLRQALQDLLKEYENNCGRHDMNEDVDLAMVLVTRKSKDLRRHLRRAIVDHVSDAFLDTRTPLSILIAAAESGDTNATREAGEMFIQHAENMIAVAHFVCDMTNDNEGLRVIKYTATQLSHLAPQVINAAHLLCQNNDSVVAQENMKMFAEIWEQKVITLDDFLAVSEAHIIEDAINGQEAIIQGNGDMLDRAAGAIRGRSLRVCSAVDEEMSAMPSGPFTDRVKNATRRLRNDVLQTFAEHASAVVQRLSDEDPSTRGQTETNRDIDEFMNACTLVHESVKDIRNALLVNRNPEDVDSDNEYEEDGQTNVLDGRSQVSDGPNQQRVMRHLPEEDKKKIQEQIDVFKIAHTKFEREVAKWDETGNDLIVLAKHMAIIMQHMMEFTRGHGPLKTTSDVIRAAQEISVAGSKLNALAKQIGQESRESRSRDELDAYLSKITLFTHQLNICSRVKADVQQVGDELKVTHLDSALSLIQTARNLLNAVVHSVKAAYIASTKCAANSRGSVDAAIAFCAEQKERDLTEYENSGVNAKSVYRRPDGDGPRVTWHLAPPQKQPLVHPQKNGGSGVVRRASERRPMAPMRELAQFHQ
ncbi:unnamed protein product, partial [Mesorhabditis belari]|uniref:Alpha-catenin n=1 Tax=Mesorhabditis belari TaxID=2138241 RepID=A0AAF3F2C7_9BILA